MEVSLEKMFVDIGILRVKPAKLLKLGLYMWMFDDVSKIGKAPYATKMKMFWLRVLRSVNDTVCVIWVTYREKKCKVTLPW